jgi:hypothetical protein
LRRQIEVENYLATHMEAGKRGNVFPLLNRTLKIELSAGLARASAGSERVHCSGSSTPHCSCQRKRPAIGRANSEYRMGANKNLADRRAYTHPRRTPKIRGAGRSNYPHAMGTLALEPSMAACPEPGDPTGSPFADVPTPALRRADAPSRRREHAALSVTDICRGPVDNPPTIPVTLKVSK